MFYKQILIREGLPFDLTITTKRSLDIQSPTKEELHKESEKGLKMKKKQRVGIIGFVLFFLIFPFIIFCEEYKDFNGVWALLESYNAWKYDNEELISAKKIKVDNDVFLGLTNSIIIQSQDNLKFFTVPGGKWNIIRIDKIDDFTYTMDLKSLWEDNVFGSLLLSVKNESEIYFTKGNLSEVFEKELNQSFLMFGVNMPYKLCDLIND